MFTVELHFSFAQTISFSVFVLSLLLHNFAMHVLSSFFIWLLKIISLISFFFCRKSKLFLPCHANGEKQLLTPRLNAFITSDKLDLKCSEIEIQKAIKFNTKKCIQEKIIVDVVMYCRCKKYVSTKKKLFPHNFHLHQIVKSQLKKTACITKPTFLYVRT